MMLLSLLSHIPATFCAHATELDAVGAWLFDFSYYAVAIISLFLQSTACASFVAIQLGYSVGVIGWGKESADSHSGRAMTTPFWILHLASLPSMLDSNLVGKVFSTWYSLPNLSPSITVVL